MVGDWSSYVLLIIVIGLLIWVFTRRRKRETPRLQAAIALVSNLNDNLRIMETRRIDPQSTRKFKDSGWKAYQDKLDFLDAGTLTSLKETFSLISEFNQKIESAKKDRSLAALQELPLEKLKGPLANSKGGLVEWLRTNLQAEMQSNRRTPFGF